jgi:hypothetical protein
MVRFGAAGAKGPPKPGCVSPDWVVCGASLTTINQSISMTNIVVSEEQQSAATAHTGDSKNV